MIKPVDENVTLHSVSNFSDLGSNLSDKNKSDEKTGFDSKAVDVDISKEGLLKSEKVFKKKGELSRRESWEDNNHARDYVNLEKDWLELMRLDNPDAYKKMQDINHEILMKERTDPDFEGSKEYYDLNSEAAGAFFDWVESCKVNGRWQNPLLYHHAVRNTLETLYSDGNHDLRINFGKNDIENEGIRGSIWFYNAKFNVLLDPSVFNLLASPTDEANRNNIAVILDSAVRNMKDAEKNYEGDKQYLKFGVMIDEHHKVTYHANYDGCENKEGISANSADELLKMLEE